MSSYADVVEYVRKLSTTQLSCGKTLRELTDYQDITLWWFARFDLIDILLGLPDGDSDYQSRGVRFQAKVARIPLFLFGALNFGFDFARKILINFLLVIYKRYRKTACQDKAAAKILFTAEDITWREVTDYQTGQIGKTDAFFDSVLKILRDKHGYKSVGTYPLIKYVYPARAALQSLRVLIDKLKNWDVPHRPINLYWSVGAWRAEYKAARHFKKIWTTLKSDHTFCQLCMFKERDLRNLVSGKLRFYLLVLFPYAVKRMAMAQRILNQEKPDLILLNNEYGIFERSLLIAGKSRGIPTLAVQHGYLNPCHYGYMYDKGDISPEGRVTSPYCPIPDKTAVYGAYFQDLLTETSAYPKSSVAITGQPRYDMLNTLQECYQREEILADYRIDPACRVVLWTTQCLGASDEENMRNLRAVRQVVEDVPNCVIIIKQHPREGKVHTDMIKQQLELPNEKIVLVPRTADTFKLIRACDVMITKYSTTALEALGLDKALVIMNLSGEPDKVEYVDQGVALGVYREEDLVPALKKLLNDDAGIAEQRKNYIAQYLYRNDGQASQRVVNLIIQMIRN